MRQRAQVINGLLAQRLERILPMAMRESGLDMWLILCQEDDLDPVFTTMIPMDTWCPILQILVFYDHGEGRGVERINISGTDTHELYDRPYQGQVEEAQWSLLQETVERLRPDRIGINVGATQWAAGGLTHNLYGQLVERLPEPYVGRLESAEPLATRWLSTLTAGEIEIYDYVANVAHHLIRECYSRKAIVPGVTTVEDLQWYYWQRCAELGLQIAFKPYFSVVRNTAAQAGIAENDPTIYPGDLIHCDVGIRYLRLNSDHQQWAYILNRGEQDVPEGLNGLMRQANRLQDVFMAEFKRGLTGNELLQNILARARQDGVPNPKVYSHSVGLFLHEPGPLIGLPWEQERCPGRGDVRLEDNNSFTMELSVAGPVPEWGGQAVRLGLEEDVVFTRDECRPLDGRQTSFHLI
jgi:Xaa-Pro aminopeptidase